jgi:hypothetical protein
MNPLYYLLAVLACFIFATTCALADPPAKDAFPAVDQLPSIKDLPDPLVFRDGGKVQSAQDWPKRREELKALIQFYEYGHLPPAPGNIKATEIGSRTMEEIGATEKRLKLEMGPNLQVSVHVDLTIPNGAGPFPAIICGDLCWGKIKPEIVAAIVKRGYILAEFDRTDLANDKKNVPYALNIAYPDYDPSALTAWAWGFHRVVDYLNTMPNVDKAHIAATGHSRGGKAVLLAGATDERIALTNPNNSGCGGAGCYRYQAPKSEDIAAITKSFPFWFVPRFQEFIGKIDRLPFDQHSVKALVAPRALLSTEALGDLWANPNGTQRTHLAAKQVYDFLGAPEKIAIYFREGKHEHNADDWNVLLDFADKTFFNKAVERKFNNLAFPVAEAK